MCILSKDYYTEMYMEYLLSSMYIDYVPIYIIYYSII